LDALKGAAAIAIAKATLGLPIITGADYSGTSLQLIEAHWWVTAAAIAVIVGHIFPVWLRLRGGKGVATGVGVFLMLAPIAVGLALLVFVVVVLLTRYVSLGSILAVSAIPLFLFLQNAFFQTIEPLWALMTAALAGAALIVFAHRENIRRLLSGTETKFK
jgi:glycerol-3-phosphate acyltransferase PlsY